MKRLVIVMICLLLQACSSTTKGLGTSLWNSLWGDNGAKLTEDEIRDMPYASQYVTLNGGPRLFVVLAYAEQGQQKWATQDSAVLVTQHGRLVKTLGLSDNLLEVNNLDVDPLRHVRTITEGEQWTRRAGWTEHQKVRYATLRSTFHWAGTETLDEFGITAAVHILDEEVTTDQTSWRNRYWVDNNGFIRQSRQYIGGGYFPVTTFLLKAAKE